MRARVLPAGEAALLVEVGVGVEVEVEAEAGVGVEVARDGGAGTVEGSFTQEQAVAALPDRKY